MRDAGFIIVVGISGNGIREVLLDPERSPEDPSCVGWSLYPPSRRRVFEVPPTLVRCRDVKRCSRSSPTSYSTKSSKPPSTMPTGSPNSTDLVLQAPEGKPMRGVLIFLIKNRKQ